MFKKRNRHTFQYEPDMLENYTEHGIEKGAKIEDNDVDNPDLLRIFNTTKPLGLEEALGWIETHKSDFNESTFIVDTDDGNSLLELKNNLPSVIIEKRALNRIRHLNTLLNRANEVLVDGGYMWCHAKTAILKHRMIMNKYPWGISHVIFFMHFIWHRVMPKIGLTKRLYFAVTKGKSRTYNRVEVLGRMYRAGFEVVDEEFRHGEFFVLARKVKKPIWDDVPSGSPLIKLRRIGKNGKIIGVYKFRTMYSYSEYLQPYIYEHNHLQEGGKFADDYRITPWGKWMRKLWIDELPMILNVLKGDLKLVGVRPLSKHYYSLYSPEMQELRIKVKPGLLPPGVAENPQPKTIEDVQESERKYTLAFLEHPFTTDFKYFVKIIKNILFKGRRSE